MQPLPALECTYRPLLVLLSYLISVVGAWCSLRCALQIPYTEPKGRVGWLAAAAVSMGGGAIWSMHFIAMTACRLPVRVTYDAPLMIVSLLVAVAVTGIGFHVVGHEKAGAARLSLGGGFTGLGIAAMHYMGMAAMRLPAEIAYRPQLVAASIVIAISAASLALWTAFNLQSAWRRLGSAFVMAGAVSGMHYAGMAAAVFNPVGRPFVSLASAPSRLGPGQLGFLVFGITLSVLAMLLMECRVGDARRAEEELLLREGQLQALSQRLRTVREEEAARIAREVHDDIGQMLTALRFGVAWLEKRLASARGGEREEVAAKLGSMSELLDTGEDVVYRIINELRPAILDQLGLEAAIEWCVEEFEKRTGISCRLRSSLDDTPIQAEHATALFRIVQEALTNVARHAGATEVEIRLATEGSRILLVVTDNGQGIPEDKIEDSRSIGLLGMRERARSLGGDLVIRRERGRGTTIAATIPR